jgi:hypothetical protein
MTREVRGMTFVSPSHWRGAVAVGMLALCSACTTTLNNNNEPVIKPTPVKYLPQFDTTMLLPAMIPAAGTIIPDTTVNVSPSVALSLEKIVYWDAYASIAYMIVDPLAPNWHIEEANFPGNHVHMALSMKRYYAGGAGEARAVFHRRAKELMRAGGHIKYEVLEYNESLESSVMGSQRTAFGVVHFTPKPPG